MCYSDLPYLYTGRGLVELAWPFTDDPQVRARFEVMEYPVGISYWAYGAAWATHWLSGSPDLEPRYDQDPGALFGQPDIQREIQLFVVVNAVGFAALALLSAWFLAGVHRDRPWDAAAFALSPGPGAGRAGQLGPDRGRGRRRARCGPGRAAARS